MEQLKDTTELNRLSITRPIWASRRGLVVIGLAALLMLALAAAAVEYWPRSGRYQLQRADRNVLYLVDTARGRCWIRPQSARAWYPLK